MSSTANEKSNLSGLISEKEKFWEMIRALVLGNADADDVLELYYWTRDPELLAMLRVIVLLPDRSRREIVRFFAEADPASISLVAQTPKRLILTS